MKTRNLKKMNRAALVLCATLGLGGCTLEVPDLNRPSEDSLLNSPTRSGVVSAAVGLLVGNRAGLTSENGFVSLLGVLGRESYVMDTADPRYISEMLAGVTLDSGSPAFGGNFWVNPYANIRNANTLMHALDKVAGVTDAEKEAIRGFALTMQALDFLVVIDTRDLNGAPIDVDRAPTDALAPIADKPAVLAHIASLLDEARVHLLAGGTTFPFPLGGGFTDFDQPGAQMSVPSFIRFNRAVKARVDVYNKDWNTALTDVAMSFITPDGSLDLGVYHTFGTGSGDTANTLNDPNLYAHPSLRADADKQADGSLDARFQRKVKAAAEPRTYQGVTATDVFTIYPSATSPIAIIRNEELILLRAEANLHLGNTATAADDINRIRTRSGNLPARADLTADNITDELLKQRRYSLLFEGGHRWIDARRYDKLGELPLDQNLTGASVHESFPLPVAETDARK